MKIAYYRILPAPIYLMILLAFSVSLLSQSAPVEVRVEVASSLKYNLGKEGPREPRWKEVTDQAARELVAHLKNSQLVGLRPWIFRAEGSHNDIVLSIEEALSGEYHLAVGLELSRPAGMEKSLSAVCSGASPVIGESSASNWHS